MYVANSSALRDTEFLKRLDTYPQREVIAKVITINLDEEPIAEITGKVTNGNITVDGTSSCRRTCNLTLITTDSNVNELDWLIHTKYILSIGIKNYIDTEKYPEWIWFPLGTYVTTSIGINNNINGGFTISLTGKDKMCLIDGTVGGALFASHDFGRLEVVSSRDDTITREPIEIKDIIREAVHVYANEPYANIIINDLDDVSVELLDYKVSNQNCFVYLTCDNYDFLDHYDTQIAFSKEDVYEEFLLPRWQDGLEMKVLNDPGVPYDNKYIRVIKYLQYGDTAGYRRTPLIYPSETGELTIDAGGTIGDLLKKIVDAFGEFEYFYDVYGRFVFQRKRIYHNVVWNGTVPDVETSVGYFTSSEASQTIYDFTNGLIIESYANKPDLANVRNDWAIWGHIETGDKDSKYACHLRYAIDDKPIAYHCLSNDTWYFTEGYDILTQEDKDETELTERQELINEYIDYIKWYADAGRLQEFVGNHIKPKINMRIKYVDWREILYRMAIDYQNALARIEALDTLRNRGFTVGIINPLLINDNTALPLDSRNYILIEDEEEEESNEEEENPESPRLDVDNIINSVIRYGLIYNTDKHTFTRIDVLDFLDYNTERQKNNLPEITFGQYLKQLNKTLFFYKKNNVYKYPSTTNLDQWYEEWLARGLVHIDDENENENKFEISEDLSLDIISKEIKKWEKRLNNKYAIYFADLLSFWNIYYKTENNLTYDDVPDMLQQTLTFLSQMMTSVSSVSFLAALSTYYNSLNNADRATNVDHDGYEALILNAQNAYILRLGELALQLTDYLSKVQNTTDDERIPYHNHYTSTLLEDIFDRAALYCREQVELVRGGGLQDATLELYNAYAEDNKELVLLFKAALVVLKKDLINLTYEMWQNNKYWNPNVIRCDIETEYKIKFTSPESMLFWIDFLDAYSTLGKYKVSVIGHRAKVVNDDKVKAIFFREVPSVLWLDPGDDEFEDIDNLSYARLRLSGGLENYFLISRQGKDAKDVLDTLVYETTHYNETITVNCLPIYYLEPNHRIRVVDNDSGIRGEYIIKNYSLQLNYDGMMSITAYKAADRII